jgi:hypothetical protein
MGMPMQPQSTTSPRVPAYLVDEAARIVGKSATWIRKKRAIGALEPATIDGRSAVTAASLHALIARRAARERRLSSPQAAPVGFSQARHRSHDSRPTHLRLVIDNTS